jgi:hypothetical protein
MNLEAADFSQGKLIPEAIHAFKIGMLVHEKFHGAFPDLVKSGAMGIIRQTHGRVGYFHSSYSYYLLADRNTGKTLDEIELTPPSRQAGDHTFPEPTDAQLITQQALLLKKNFRNSNLFAMYSQQGIDLKLYKFSAPPSFNS